MSDRPEMTNLAARVIVSTTMNPDEVLITPVLDRVPGENWSAWIERCQAASARLVNVMGEPRMPT